MSKRGWLVGLVAALVPALGGCIEMTLIRAITDDDEDDSYAEPYYSDDYSDDYAQDPLAVSNARLHGDMGDVAGFRDDAALYNAYGSEEWATVEVHAGDGSTYAAMAILEIEGGLHHPDLRPGTHHVFDAMGRGGNLWVSMIACSGPSEGMWEYDAPADAVEVSVGEGTEPGSTRINFSATMTASDGHTQVATGSFDALAAE